METLNCSETVSWYDASQFEEDEYTAAGYFYPPLGEAIVTELVRTIPNAQHSTIETAKNADHFRVTASTLSTLLDCVSTLLQSEGRNLRI